MTRWSSSTNETAAGLPSIALRLLVSLDFASGFVRAHDGVGDLINPADSSNTYNGLGSVGGIQAIREDVQGSVNALKLMLAGPSAILTTAMTETYQGRSAVVYAGLLKEDGTWYADPEICWSGKMDVMEVELVPAAEDGPGNSVITLSCETRLRKEPRVARYTDVDQQLLYSGDKGFEHIKLIPGFKVAWGAKGYGIGVGQMTSLPTMDWSRWDPVTGGIRP